MSIQKTQFSKFESLINCPWNHIPSFFYKTEYHYQTFILAITFHFIIINNQNSTVLYSQFAIWWAKKMKGKWEVKEQFSFLCWNNCLCLIVLKHRCNFLIVILLRINNITRAIPTISEFIKRGDLVLSWGLLQFLLALSGHCNFHCYWFSTFVKIKTKLLTHLSFKYIYFFSNIYSLFVDL